MVESAVRIVVFLPAVVLAWSLIIGGPVEELPFGIQPALDFFASTVHGMIDFMPWLQAPLNVMLWALVVKSFVLTIDAIKFVREIVG